MQSGLLQDEPSHDSAAPENSRSPEPPTVRCHTQSASQVMGRSRTRNAFPGPTIFEPVAHALTTRSLARSCDLGFSSFGMQPFGPNKSATVIPGHPTGPTCPIAELLCSASGQSVIENHPSSPLKQHTRADVQMLHVLGRLTIKVLDGLPSPTCLARIDQLVVVHRGIISVQPNSNP